MKKILLTTVFVLACLFFKTQTCEFRKFHDNGRIKESGFFTDNLRDSIWTTYDERGNKTSVAFFNKGVKIGTWQILQPDKLIEIVYINGRKSKYLEYSLDNKLITEKQF